MKEKTISTIKHISTSLAFLGAFLVLGLLAGCTFDAEHNRAHWESFKQDAHDSHRFVDRHFFHYDWEDPDNWYIEK